jgi:hypothetical protein
MSRRMSPVERRAAIFFNVDSFFPPSRARPAVGRTERAENNPTAERWMRPLGKPRWVLQYGDVRKIDIKSFEYSLGRRQKISKPAEPY